MTATATRGQLNPLTFRLDQHDRNALKRNAERLGIPVGTLIKRALLEAGHLR